MPDRARPLDQLTIIAANAREPVRAAQQRRSEVMKQIVKSEQTIQESRKLVDRADESLRRLSPSITMPNETPADPKCPNCGQPMTLIATRGTQDHNTFECKGCKVVYMTEDHTQVTGQPPPQSKSN